MTEREQQALEQMREAREQGSTLKDYAGKIGVDVRQLYELRRHLVRKGAFGLLPRSHPGPHARFCAWALSDSRSWAGTPATSSGTPAARESEPESAEDTVSHTLDLVE